MNFGRILTKWNQNTVKRGRSVKKVGLSCAASLKVWWITIHCCVVKQEIVCDRNFLMEKFNKCVKNSTASKHKSHKANLYFEMFNVRTLDMALASLVKKFVILLYAYSSFFF